MASEGNVERISDLISKTETAILDYVNVNASKAADEWNADVTKYCAEISKMADKLNELELNVADIQRMKQQRREIKLKSTLKTTHRCQKLLSLLERRNSKIKLLEEKLETLQAELLTLFNTLQIVSNGHHLCTSSGENPQSPMDVRTAMSSLSTCTSEVDSLLADQMCSLDFNSNSPIHCSNDDLLTAVE